MWIIWILVGLVVGWLVPEPTLVWHGDGQRYTLVKWCWMWIRDKAGMN